MIWVIIAAVVLPEFTAAASGVKNPTEFCFKELGIIDRPGTPEALVKTMDSPEFRKCMLWAPKDTDAHVPIPSAMERLERSSPNGDTWTPRR